MSTNYLDLENDIKNQNLHSIYVLYGDEEYLKQEYLKKIKKVFGELSLGINYILLDETNIDTLITNIETLSFGYEKKLIVVKNSNIFKKDTKSPMKDKFKQYILENMQIINDSCTIVFIEETVHKMDLYKTVEKNAVVLELKELKPSELKTRLKRICTMYKVQISDENLIYLIENAGTKMQTLINEVRKLIEFAGENGTIQKEDIDKLTINADVCYLCYIILNISKIIIILYNHFKKIYLSILAINEKKDIVEALGLKPNQVFLVSKYRKQASYFKENELEELLKELIDLDYKSKNGMIDLEIGLKSIICKNC